MTQSYCLHSIFVLVSLAVATQAHGASLVDTSRMAIAASPQAAVAQRSAPGNLTGTWQAPTANGRPLVLELKVNGQDLSGKLTLAQQPVDITEGKVDGQTFSFKAGVLEGRAIVAKGRVVGEDLELTVEGVKAPLTLKRVK